MKTLTIRNLDDHVKQKLRSRAAAGGISMEQGARRVLTRSVQQAKSQSAGRKPTLTVDEVLAFGERLPDIPFDQKKEFDELWSYLEEE
jgi:plasmid stability protein